MATITSGGLAYGAGDGLVDDQRDGRRRERIDALDRDGRGGDLDRGDACQPEHRQGLDSQQFTATGTYSDNSTANLTSQVDVGLVDHLGGDHHRRRPGVGAGHGLLDDQRATFGARQRLDDADCHRRDVGVDRG